MNNCASARMASSSSASRAHRHSATHDCNSLLKHATAAPHMCDRQPSSVLRHLRCWWPHAVLYKVERTRPLRCSVSSTPPPALNSVRPWLTMLCKRMCSGIGGASAEDSRSSTQVPETTQALRVEDNTRGCVMMRAMHDIMPGATASVEAHSMHASARQSSAASFRGGG